MILPVIAAPPGLHIPGRILALTALSLIARALLAEAYARLRRGRPTSLSDGAYARRLGYPVHHVQAALSELERAGYLERHYTRAPVRHRYLVFLIPGGVTPRKSQFVGPPECLPPKGATTL